ncbi:MAG TPA: 2-oxoacid:acceptor oxidoreductase subunit alpha [Synergistaceae bacterium]|nr:2-oxoacid:acceptor oxidoreductase subunit alpha [Synergistaceae bacterium]
MILLPREGERDVSVVLTGAAGQGIQTAEDVLGKVLKRSGFHIFATREFMSRVRGGNNSTEIRVSSRRVRAFVDRIDLLVCLNKGLRDYLKGRISDRTVIVGDAEEMGDELAGRGLRFFHVPLSSMAKELGNPVYANVVAAGVVAALFDVDFSLMEGFFEERFGARGGDIISKNVEAARKGYEIARGLAKEISVKVDSDTVAASEYLLSGSDAVALGAIAGGCNMAFGYPMSPATGVLSFLSQRAEEFGIVTEQTEDEISAMNMALGGWYAGGRAMVTTSGGGFDLMSEGLSLAGIAESPMVIHLGQRPGPATGLATRTEQADLELALYAGHGEFPRAILAPGSIEEAFYMTQHAFNLAARYQVPVFVLTDQYLLDSSYNVPRLSFDGLKVEKHIVKTDKDYKRYLITDDGVSPRGIPGYGEGLIAFDSNEHGDTGRNMDEDPKIRTAMNAKRLRKLKGLAEASLPPTLYGDDDYDLLLVGWGSTLYVIEEALLRFARPKTAFLQVKQPFPLHSSIEGFLRKAKVVVDVECNATGQLAKLMKLYADVTVDHKFLSWSGMEMTVEELLERLREIAI